MVKSQVDEIKLIFTKRIRKDIIQLHIRWYKLYKDIIFLGMIFNEMMPHFILLAS